MPNSPRPAPSDSRADIDARAAVEKQLEEVEAAIAILEGRDPERLRKLRETRAQAEREFQEIVKRMDAQRARKARRLARRRRQIAVRVVASIVAVGGLLALGRVGLYGRERWKTVNATLDELSLPYLALGMKPASYKRATGDRVELSVAPGACSIALAATSTGESVELHIDRGLYSFGGENSIAWCSCAEEDVVVTGKAASGDALVGIKLLSAPGAILGGSRALQLLEPAPNAFGPLAEECEAAHIDGWVRAARYPKLPFDQSFLDEEGRAPLLEAGFRVVARVPADHPLGGVPPLDDSCFLAVGQRAPISLRVEGGAWPIRGIAERPLGWCSKEPRAFTLWREGEDAEDLLVLAASSSRIGGLLGLQEIAERGGLGQAVSWAPPEDLGEDAADMLRASGALDPVIVWPEPAEGRARAANPRVVAMSLLPGGSFLPAPKEDAVMACAPELTQGQGGRSLCLQSWPQAFRRVGGADLGGLAEASLPYWLSSIQGVDHPTGLSHFVSLLALARSLHPKGFEPTVLTGVVEQRGGVDILGRAGEGAIVAVGIIPRAPWVIPYTDGPQWSLDTDARIIDLPPGHQIQLTSRAALAIPTNQRRTVVFRRSIQNEAADDSSR